MSEKFFGRVTNNDFFFFAKISRKDNFTLEITDTYIVGAMGPSGGGRNKITPRLTRHFNVLSIESFNDELMRSIFYPIIDWHFQKPGFPIECRRYSRVFIDSLVD